MLLIHHIKFKFNIQTKYKYRTFGEMLWVYFPDLRFARSEDKHKNVEQSKNRQNWLNWNIKMMHLKISTHKWEKNICM